MGTILDMPVLREFNQKFARALFKAEDKAMMATSAGKPMTVDEANQTHDWVKGVELPWCKVCGLGKISAHIWGDDDWTKSPIACSGQTETLERANDNNPNHLV